ncbi:FMN-binding protein [Lentzea sp. NPDC005914]|uniref:FMN-binding protein n=1 Tax=Lentzea sp. NPDC005914 TaxID=3154572 RepID=UPI0033EBAE15
MHRAIPAMLLSASGLIAVWQFEPATSVAPSGQAVAGEAVPTKRGTVQVEVVFAGDRIADVRVLRAPDSAPTRMALPILREEALLVQSADIDTVSGATITSEAYSRSLQYAIDHR